MSNSSPYLEVLRIPCTSKEKLPMDNSRHTKKRDCTVAVPLLEAFALPNHIEQQREAHADMYTRTYAYSHMWMIRIHISRTSIVAKF
jgi:hypothetical protein